MARFEPLDVTSEESWAAVVSAATQHFGKLDVLVNNAGISGSAEQDFYSTDAWHRIMAVNATGMFIGNGTGSKGTYVLGSGAVLNSGSFLEIGVFGDGTFRVFRAPGHTPGSQFAVVRLKKTGPVILTSDTVYLKESLDKNLIPPIPGTWSPNGMYEGYQRIRLIRDTENAQLFIAHDAELFKATKHAPEFYE